MIAARDVNHALAIRRRSRRSVLIYCPDLAGHRQIYCDVLTDFFLTKGFGVVLAVGAPQREKASEVRFSPYIEQYREDPFVTIVPIAEQAPGAPGEQQWHALQRLQKDFQVERTFFVDGDALRPGLSVPKSLFSKPKVPGKNCGIFLQVGFIYYPIPWARHSLVRSFRGLFWWLRFQLRENLFYRVILRRVWDFDVCFFPDDNLVKRFDYKEYHYLPEIHRSFRFRTLDNSGDEGVAREYEDFLSANSGKDVVLYFGNAERRKGYDFLLKLVHDHRDLVFVHFGRHATEEAYDYPVDAFRDGLRSSGRLFEFLGGFVASPQLIDEFFSSVKFILLPYRNHYKSSGLLIQATEYGKPVLVPDIGLVNELVTENGLGLTYKHLWYDDFESQFFKLRSDGARYSDKVIRFHQGFTKDRIFAALEQGLALA